MDQAPLESPSPDFAQKLMQRIESGQRKELFQYRPLLPKGFFVVLLIGFVGLLAHFFSQYEPGTQQDWFSGVELSPILEVLWSWTDRFTSSKIMVQAVLIFGLLCLVQFSFLKGHLERRAPKG